MTSTPFRQLHHICIVVRDIDKSVAYYESIGIGPWQDYPPLAEYTDLSVPNPDAFHALRYKFVEPRQRAAAALPAAAARLSATPLPRHARRRRVPHRLRVGRRPAARAGRRPRAPRPHARTARPTARGFVYFDTLDQAGVVLLARKTPSRS